MALIVRAVTRLPQRAQHQVTQNPLLRLAFHLGHQLLIVPRRDVDLAAGERHLLALLRPVAVAVGEGEALHRNRAHAQRVAEVRRDLFEVQYAFRVGLLVDAVDRRFQMLFEMRGHSLIGRQHELLDQAVRDIPRRPRDPHHGAELVELDERLRQVEVDRPAPHALAIQDQRQFLHELEARHQRLVPFAQRGVALQQLDGRWCTSSAPRCGSRLP